MPGVIVPRKTVGEVQRLIEDNEAEVKIELSQGKIRFTIGNVVLTSKLIDGTFPDYGRVIPQNNDKELIVDKKDFEAAVDRVSTISSERGRAVKLALSAGKLVLSVTNPDSGSATEELEVEYASDAARYRLQLALSARHRRPDRRRGRGAAARRSRLADAGAGQGFQGRALRADADAGVSRTAVLGHPQRAQSRTDMPSYRAAGFRTPRSESRQRSYWSIRSTEDDVGCRGTDARRMTAKTDIDMTASRIHRLTLTHFRNYRAASLADARRRGGAGRPERRRQDQLPRGDLVSVAGTRPAPRHAGGCRRQPGRRLLGGVGRGRGRARAGHARHRHRCAAAARRRRQPALPDRPRAGEFGHRLRRSSAHGVADAVDGRAVHGRGVGAAALLRPAGAGDRQRAFQPGVGARPLACARATACSRCAITTTIGATRSSARPPNLRSRSRRRAARPLTRLAAMLRARGAGFRLSVGARSCSTAGWKTRCSTSPPPRWRIATARSCATAAPRDAAAGRTLDGPHLTDLQVVYAPKSMPARDASTGEQKALLIGLVLAHADAGRRDDRHRAAVAARRGRRASRSRPGARRCSTNSQNSARRSG